MYNVHVTKQTIAEYDCSNTLETIRTILKKLRCMETLFLQRQATFRTSSVPLWMTNGRLILKEIIPPASVDPNPQFAFSTHLVEFSLNFLIRPEDSLYYTYVFGSNLVSKILKKTRNVEFPQNQVSQCCMKPEISIFLFRRIQNK